ncbi:30S ribosomal protein S9 [Candidatus Uhrbacteria bacterium]|jgi:small subunit ribosomal protein S9|nr:30S ribosomal protein S9 [Candidatus Uhrbacteria bacterium]
MADTTSRYIESVGRRKSATARVRLHQGGTGKITVNDRDFQVHIPVSILQQALVAPLVLTGTREMFDITVSVKGGGIHGQADAIRLGIARGLVDFNPEFRATLKTGRFLTRDARVKERKKPGLRGARRAPQWSKR